MTARENKALQNERVEMTPGGSRKHVLTCTTPGGTTRTASYTSPSKAAYLRQCEEYGVSLEVEETEGVLEAESFVRRCDAIDEAAPIEHRCSGPAARQMSQVIETSAPTPEGRHLDGAEKKRKRALLFPEETSYVATEGCRAQAEQGVGIPM